MTYKLVLLRHGQSAWNKTNQFTGWVDVPLTEQGVEEAKNGGKLMKDKGVLPDIVFTSLLRRAIEDIARFDICRRHGIIVAESAADQALPPLSGPYSIYREYRYGKIKLTVYHRNED